MAVEWTEATIATDAEEIRARVYRDARTPRTAPLVMHLHGGAFIGGSLDAGTAIATVLAEAGAIVVSIDYPLAPVAPFPQPLVASFAALRILDQERGRWANKKSGLYIAGEEAGGNLAASLALMARDQQTPRLAGQILISPLLDPCLATKSLREADVGPVGCPIADGWHQYLGTPDKACHPYASPLGATRLGGLADTLIVTAEDDPLRDEAVAYACRLRESSVAADLQILPSGSGWPGPARCHEGLNSSLAANLRERFVGFFFDRTSSDRGSPPSPGKMAAKAGSQ